MPFTLVSGFKPTGDQPQAIDKLVKGVKQGGMQTLLGVTGSGKTFTIANVIAKMGKPALIISHNKTLAAQLYEEFKEFFPNDPVGYFVSYYDYYQPESYIPQTDTYIEKDATVNEKIEQMRLAATSALLSGRTPIIVATVSCIYGIGSPEDAKEVSFSLKEGQGMKRQDLLAALTLLQFERNDMALVPGSFRARGDTVDVLPAYSDTVVRVQLEAGKVQKLSLFNRVTGKAGGGLKEFLFLPAKHFVVPARKKQAAIDSIKRELESMLPKMGEFESRRLQTRTNYDLEMIEELGFCNGIENYSRHFDGRAPGSPPYCLLDYLGDDFLLVIDESHVTLPQIGAMHSGDFSRKKSLVDFGFRLPSAFDNRPLRFDEFEKYMKNTIFVSATPADYEAKHSFQVVEQLVRPTGIIDPEIIVRNAQGQGDDLVKEAKKVAKAGNRVLVTTLTKRLAEDLAEYLCEQGVKARYLHSEITTLERIDILRRLRLGEYDCLVGINLLREGLDLPEVALVAIMDADKEGFLRSTTSLIQTMGRAARNVESRVILYAERVTDSMKRAMDEANRRRAYQVEFNKKHGITPKNVEKKIAQTEEKEAEALHLTRREFVQRLIEIETEMKRAAEDLDFERAIALRDKLSDYQKMREGEFPAKANAAAATTAKTKSTTTGTAGKKG
ncbi:MAG: excinuclease ABC subunit UvrB [Candidatus Micrarchaeia archaeon]|jgi:excinuclease ABC subunit B